MVLCWRRGTRGRERRHRAKVSWFNRFQQVKPESGNKAVFLLFTRGILFKSGEAVSNVKVRLSLC